MSRKEQPYQIAVRLTHSEYGRIEEMIAAGIFRSAADFARKAVRDKLREAEPIAVRDTSRSHAEKLIDGYLTKHPGPHSAWEIAEALGLDFRTTLEAIKRMIDSGRIHKARSEGR
jgi:Arc/MetJ-type ribon-helix-helix transcriptional regulator